MRFLHVCLCGLKIQHTATHCSTLQHTAAHCNTFMCFCAMWSSSNSVASAAWRTATHCNTLQHITQYVLQCVNALQHTAILYSTLQHTPAHYDTFVRTCTMREMRRWQSGLRVSYVAIVVNCEARRPLAKLQCEARRLHMLQCVVQCEARRPLCQRLIQRTATYCNTMRHAATQCNMLQHTATCCNTF